MRPMKAIKGSFFYGVSSYACSSDAIAAAPAFDPNLTALTEALEAWSERFCNHALTADTFIITKNGARVCGDGFEIEYSAN